MTTLRCLNSHWFLTYSLGLFCFALLTDGLTERQTKQDEQNIGLPRTSDHAG